MKTQDVAMIAVCAALYAMIGRLTDLGVTVGGVAFWPAAVIPAVFAVLFGGWVGGIGAGIGIFIRDMLFHGDPLLSLCAGVSANFVGFFLLGHISRSSFGWKKLVTSAVVGSVIIVAGLLLPTHLLPAETEAFTVLSPFQSTVLFVVTVVLSVVIIITIAKIWPKWRNYGVGSVTGLGIGSAIIAVVVWAYSQVFFSPTGYFKAAIGSSFIPIIFVWTFATEIPFILIGGPLLIEACYLAFPSLRPPQKIQHRES